MDRVKKIVFRKRAWAALLSLALLAGVQSPAHGVALAASQGSARAADPNTLAGWTAFFGEGVEDTTHVGRIWTDKTVQDNDIALPSTNIAVTRSDPSHFLTALSAISSYKNIVGQSTIPVDVMLVLDVSGSMADQDTVAAMVQAANASIRDLLDLNIHNRVGLVLYSGNPQVGNSAASTATLLLELDRYLAGESRFLAYSRTGQGGAGYRVHAADNLMTQSGQRVPAGGAQVTGGTYTQNGVFVAMGQFLAAENTQVQGSKRIPILVLMSDGAPTAGTVSYTNVGASHMGDGVVTSGGVAFATQLTAAHARAKMEAKYGRSALFYTLGLGFDKLPESEKYLALSVLDTAYSTQTLNNYWEEFQKLGAGQAMTLQYRTSASQNNLTARLTRAAGDGVESIRYVDEYFAAANAQDLLEAFDSIVEEIIIQSRYYPTQTDGENVDLSGYLVFTDRIGEYMEVKKLSGLAYGSELYTGKEFAQIMAGAYDQATHQLDLENSYALEFVRSLQERLNLTQSQAIDLILRSFAQGQIYHNSAQDFGNALAWYGGKTGGYLAPAISGQSPPEGAATINQTYAYFGVPDVDAVDSNLMYIGVRLQTDLASGRQMVRMSVPASLVPVTEYNVTIEGDNLEQAQTAAVSRNGVQPVRLFYEVGLEEGLSASTVRDRIPQDYPYLDGNGGYAFYTNAWSKEAAQTQVTYTPSEENEFYYYTRHTPLYQKQADGAFVPLTAKPDPAVPAYYKHQLFSGRVFGQQTQVKHVYWEVVPQALQYARQGTDGSYYIPKGTSKMLTHAYTMEKTDNRTGSYPYALEPHLETTGGVVTGARTVLGNNGRLRIQAPGSSTGGGKVPPTGTRRTGGGTDSPAPDLILENLEDTPPPLSTIPQTGDGRSPILWLVLMLASGVVCILALRGRKGSGIR